MEDTFVFLQLLTVSLCAFRDQSPAGGAAEMSGPADRNASPAAAGPSGLLQKEGRNWAGVLQEPGEAGRTLHGQDPEHQGSPAVQVRCLPVFFFFLLSPFLSLKMIFLTTSVGKKVEFCTYLCVKVVAFLWGILSWSGHAYMLRAKTML